MSKEPTYGYTKSGRPIHASTFDYHRAETFFQKVNSKFGLKVTLIVGTMWCAYLFAILALFALPSAIHQGTYYVIVWLSSSFLQLVLLPIIIVGQNIQAKASDVRAEKTLEDVDVILDKFNIKTQGGLKDLADHFNTRFDDLVSTLKGQKMSDEVNEPLEATLAEGAEVQAHAQSRILHETIYYPEHIKRGSESSEFERNKREMIASGKACWICGGTAESTGHPLEGHHLNVEWALINSISLEKVQEYFPKVTSLEEFLDSKENLMILCAKHHRSDKYGIHMVTMPAWIAPRIQENGWDLVNGPNAAAEPEDESKWYPEH